MQHHSDANGWIDLEEFNMVLTFNKFKTTDEQPGLYFHEFKNMVRIRQAINPFFRCHYLRALTEPSCMPQVGTLLADDFVISKQDAYKTPAHPFVNEVRQTSTCALIPLRACVLMFIENGRFHRKRHKLPPQTCDTSRPILLL